MVTSPNRVAVNADLTMVWVSIPTDAGVNKAKGIVLIGRLSYESDLGVGVRSLRHHHLHRAAGGVDSPSPRALTQAMGTV